MTPEPNEVPNPDLKTNFISPLNGAENSPASTPIFHLASRPGGGTSVLAVSSATTTSSVGGVANSSEKGGAPRVRKRFSSLLNNLALSKESSSQSKSVSNCLRGDFTHLDRFSKLKANFANGGLFGSVESGFSITSSR